MAGRKNSNSGAGNAITERERLSFCLDLSIDMWFVLCHARAILRDHGSGIPPETSFPLAALIDRASLLSDALNHYCSDKNDLSDVDKIVIDGAVNIPSRLPVRVEA